MSPGRGTGTECGATAEGVGGVDPDEESPPTEPTGDAGEPDVVVHAARAANVTTAAHRSRNRTSAVTRASSEGGVSKDVQMRARRREG